MAKFVIAPHMRLHEWIADEKGYFTDEGLDYTFRDNMTAPSGQAHDFAPKVGAYQTFEQGRPSSVSCACHWTVNMAASAGHGRLYSDCYSVSPCGVFVAPDSPVKRPEDLANVPITVGFQSGSHYSTIQALEQVVKPEEINLDFGGGLLYKRLELLIEGKIAAASLFSGPYYLLQQLGFRKVLDTTFMMSAMIHGDPDPEDVRKYFRALKRAQTDLDLRPELYTKHYYKEMPERFHEMMDTRLWGPGERIVFEPYSREIFEESRRWIDEHGIFEGDSGGSGDYSESTYSLSAAE